LPYWASNNKTAFEPRIPNTKDKDQENGGSPSSRATGLQRHTNLSKMTPKERGTTLGTFRSEYIVYGDFECQEPYILATSAYWVPLSKLTKNVTRATALDEIEIFEANMAELRANEFDELSSSENEDEDDE